MGKLREQQQETFDNLEGKRIRFMGWGEPDPYSELEAGDEGDIVLVDAVGTIHVRWDTGSYLGLATNLVHRQVLPDKYVILDD